MLPKQKFTASYSGGKDSALAIYRAIKAGYQPISLFTTYNNSAERSWFHGIPKELLEEVATSMNLPLYMVPTGFGDGYATDFENGLRTVKKQGADTCIFGDIDIQEHYDWCDARCKATELASYFPLWNQSRKELVYELIDSGFKTVITIINTDYLSEEFLGKTLTKELAQKIEDSGADICGENGEYHTFVYDGPLFNKPINFKLGNLVTRDKMAILPISSSK